MTTLRWQNFNDIEYTIEQIHPNMSWKDCHVECATLFHSRVNMFMYKHILNDNGILGKVKEYVIHYELQHHGYIHVHIILWVEEENLNIITNEIVVVIPVVFDGTTTKFIVLKDSLQNKLFKMVLRKQFHECQNWCIWKGRNGNCRFGFLLLHMLNPILFSMRKQIDGNTIDHDMKIEMLFHIIQLCYYYGVFIWIFYVSHFCIGHFYL